ncbi:hypothetical protein MM59RIKEN_14080 [Pusillibacter faecalis]|uniref:HMA domain-containing protein n=1 Tax=Pusillibacter faecalis TaxID=2714358 RepID=A0A810Q725_9FIRM|nr:hypothetical protein MM59RIKEN_14080 [Pusillibacter faecalis]
MREKAARGCDHCAMHIRKALKAIHGVKEMAVSFRKNRAGEAEPECNWGCCLKFQLTAD